MFKEIIDLVYSVQVNCENATYVSKSHSNTNYSNDDSLIISLIKGQNHKTNASISLLAFPSLNLEFNNINHAYLYLFLEDIMTAKNKSAKLNVIGDFDYIHIEKANWNNFSLDNLSNKLPIEISPSQINSYIKFDVTDLVSKLAKFDINYNILVSPVTSSTNTFVRFSSCNSSNPPYLVLEKFEDSHSKLSSENTYDNVTALDHENSYDDHKVLSDKHIYNEKSTKYEITNDIIDNIDLDNEDNINTSNYINIKDNKYSTDSHINIDFDYDSNDNTSNNPLLHDTNFNEIMEKIDDVYNILGNNITNIDEKLSKLDNQFTNYMNNKTDNLKKDVKSSDDKLRKLFDTVNPNSSILDFGNIISMMDSIKNTFGTSKSKNAPDTNNTIDDFSNIAKHISDKINQINDKAYSSDKNMEDSFEELSSSILNAINKNISLLTKEINDSKNEVSDD